MIKEEIKFQDSTVFEGMTSIRAIIKARELGTNDRHISKILFDKSKLDKISKEIGYLKAVSKIHGFEIVESDKAELEKITLGTSHGGIVAITENRTIPCLSEDSKIVDNALYCMIQGIEDPYNFGYSLRSLYAMGCAGIILPMRNWMSAAGVVARSSAGASELFSVYTSTPEEAIEIFKEKGYRVVCADERTDNVLGDCELRLPILLLVGGEKRGEKNSVYRADDGVLRGCKYARNQAGQRSVFAHDIHIGADGYGYRRWRGFLRLLFGGFNRVFPASVWGILSVYRYIHGADGAVYRLGVLSF